MNIQIDNYNEGVIIKNDFVYFHFSHELNNAEDGGALFYFRNDELKNVMFTIFYEEIVNYFFTNRKYGNYLNLKSTLENPIETMIELKLPRSRVFLNQHQANAFKEILSVFEDIIKDKVLLQANRNKLEIMSFINIAESETDEETYDADILSKREKCILFFKNLYLQIKFLNCKYLLLIVLRMFCVYLIINIILLIIFP